MGYTGTEMGCKAPFRDPEYLLAFWAESLVGAEIILQAHYEFGPTLAGGPL